jgi:hypothetical protein
MTDLTVEVVALDEADLDAAPPCEMITHWRWGKKQRCGRKSTHRVLVKCTVHGGRRRFLCARHMRVLRLGLVLCESCDLRSPVEFAGES